MGNINISFSKCFAAQREKKRQALYFSPKLRFAYLLLPEAGQLKE